MYHSALWCQTYSPIPAGLKFMYEFTQPQTGNVWEEVFVKSTHLSGGDTVFILNGQTRKVAEDEGCPYPLNQGPGTVFLTEQAGNIGQEIIKRGSDEYLLINPFGDTLHLYTGKGIGYYWNARPHLTGYDTAKVISYTYKTLLGNLSDSVMTIAWHGRKLEISRHYGIIYFDGFMDLNCPLITTTNQPTPFPRYQLTTPARVIGVSGQQVNEGYKTPYPADAYRFEPGDIFMIWHTRYKHSSVVYTQLSYFHFLEDSGFVNGAHVYKVQQLLNYNSFLPYNALVTSQTIPDIKPGWKDPVGKYVYKGYELANFPNNSQSGNSLVNVLQAYTPSGGPEIHLGPGTILDTCEGKVRVLAWMLFEGGYSMTLTSNRGFINQEFWNSAQDGDRYSWGLYCMKRNTDSVVNYPCAPLNQSKDLDWSEEIDIYPVPVKSVLNLHSISGKTFDHTIRLYNVQGVLLKEIPGQSQASLSLNLGDEPDGVYWISLFWDGQERQKRILKISE